MNMLRVGIKTFGVLAHHDEIDRLAAARRHAEARFRRPDVGIEIEALSHLAGRVEAALRGRRVVVVRHRPQDHAVRALAGLEG
jgi:hypothetical protein